MNTTYFHNVVRGIRLKNRVLMLRDIFGNEYYSKGSNGNIAADYYKDLFMSTNLMDMELLFSGFLVKVTEASCLQDRLCQKISRKLPLE